MVNMSRMTNRAKYRAIVWICSDILRNRIPVHKSGQIFPSLKSLMETPWVKVRKILRYEAGVVYER